MVQGSTSGNPDTYSKIISPAHVVVCWVAGGGWGGAAAWRLEHCARVSAWIGLQLREGTGREGQATRQAEVTSSPVGTVDCAAGTRRRRISPVNNIGVCRVQNAVCSVQSAVRSMFNGVTCVQL